MKKPTESTLGKKVLCNPPVRAILPSRGPLTALIDSAESLIAGGMCSDEDVRAWIAADEGYLAQRAVLDDDYAGRYKETLKAAVARLKKD